MTRLRTHAYTRSRRLPIASRRMHTLRRFILPLVLLLLALPGLSAQTPTWTNLSHGLTSPITELNSVAFGNGLFVAIKSAMSGGTLHYATSTDGTTWTARTISTSITSSGGALRVRFLDGRFLIMPVGLNGNAGLALSLTSTDGIAWTSTTIGATTTSPDEMDFGNGRVLAVGSNNFFIGSTDFSTWTGVTPGLQGAFGIQDVAFGDGRWFITTNGGGEVATSTDGTTFTKVNGLSALGGFRVEYGNGTWFFYSQQDNAVSSDGVNFTTVTRTPNVTPGGTGTIRFLNDRFVAFGPSTFQASTDGQTWTNFGAPPSLGSGFIYTAIYDFAYGNGKYVAVGGRDFPSTAALIWVTEGAPDTGEEPTGGEFTLAYQVGVTPIPGTNTVEDANLQGYAIHDGGVLIAAPTQGTPLRTALLQHKEDTLSVVLSSATGFPGDAAIHSMELANDGTRVFITPRTATSFGATHAALMKYEGGTVSTLIAHSDTVIADKEGFLHSSLIAQEAANNRVAIIGGGGFATSYLYRYQDNALTTVVAKGITAQPNGTGDGKFAKIEGAALSPDGSRLFFLANNGVNVTLPDARFGIYVEQGGAISTVVDNTTTIPGTSATFSFRGESIDFAMSPDGSRAIVMGTEYTEGEARHGIYEYTNGSLTTLVDNTAVVGTQELITIMGGVIANDGTLIFYGGGMHPTSLYRAKDGQVTLIQSGGTDGGFRSPQGLWLHGDYVYFKATNASIQPILARIPVDGSEGATEVINFYTHPDFAAIDTRDLEDLQFANGLVLLNVGAVHNGVQRSAILYGPASLLEGESTGGGSTGAPQISTQPAAKSTAPGGSVTFSVSATGNNLTYQWKLGGQAISGATSASLTIDNVQASHAGTYTVDVTNSAGTVTSVGAVLSVLSPAEYGRLSALSIRAQVGTGDNVLIAGYAIGPGTSSLPVLVRGSGPSLAALGVPSADTLQDPQISIVPPGQSTAVASNDDWAGNNDVLTKSAELGAQPFASSTSTDAAVYLTGLAPGPYTAVISGKNNGTGIALVEVYSGSNEASAPRLTAISGRSTIGAGNDVLIAGFVVHGASTRVLVRGVGPSLPGVAHRLADPQIALHVAGSATAMATNNDWGSATNASEAATLATQVGATAFTSGSKDAAMLVTLEPGVYTAVVSGVNNASGIALVEVYEVP